MEKFVKAMLERAINPEKTFEKSLIREVKKLKRADDAYIDELEDSLDTLEDKYETMLYDSKCTLADIVSSEETIRILKGRIETTKILFNKRYEILK